LFFTGKKVNSSKLFIPLSASEYSLEVKNSRFTARAHYFKGTAAQARLEVEKLKKEHPDARHVVHAFISGESAKALSFGLSDDGEPKGTAGRPVLEVLKGSGLTNTLVTIVRWFGGTKLGTGGLVSAYADAAKGCLESLEKKELIPESIFTLSLPYGLYEQFKILVEQYGGKIPEESFLEEIRLKISIPADNEQAVEKAAAELSGGKIQLIRL
jgi:uncharacterized YigZ family protein